MRAILLVIVAIGWGSAAWAQSAGDSGRPIGEILPLFDRNHCADIRDPADQLFCGDPQLSNIAAKLGSAIQSRLDRITDRRHAIEENAEWIKKRNSSCGIFGRQTVPSQNVKSAAACLLKESEERIAILLDPNFDCLATDTTAGALICGDPLLALAEAELDEHVLGLIAKLKENEAKDAFVENARWSRARDRKCDLIGKANVPLQDLAPAEPCLADYITEKNSEMIAARGDPKKVFGRHLPSPSPNADAVDLCVAQIHSASRCDDFLRVSRVLQIDTQVSEKEAQVTAEVEMVVLSPFAVCSPVASSCTGACWDLKAGQAKASPASRESFSIANRLRIEKAFTFKKADSGGWRCANTELPPVEVGKTAIAR